MHPDDEKRTNAAFAAARAERRADLTNDLDNYQRIISMRLRHAGDCLEIGLSLAISAQRSMLHPDELSADDMTHISRTLDIACLILTLGKIQAELKNIV